MYLPIWNSLLGLMILTWYIVVCIKNWKEGSPIFEPRVLQPVQRYLVRHTRYEAATVPIGVLEVFCEYADSFDNPAGALEKLTPGEFHSLIERGYRREKSNA